MTFVRLSAIISVALAASQLANAAVTKRVVCPTGHLTANEACCGAYTLNSEAFIILNFVTPALFPVVENLQANLFDGGECGEEVIYFSLQ